jgi:DNA polymerase alpha subunit A
MYNYIMPYFILVFVVLLGLDLVRRDWCPLSKDAGKFVVDQILSGQSREDIVLSIHDYMSTLADNIRKSAIDLQQFVVTKGLNKNPKDYPDCKSQAHLQVALRMLAANKPVNIGDHIPYVICQQVC